MWTTRPDGSWVGKVDLDLCLQQMRVLDEIQDLSLGTSSSSEEEGADDELYLESPTTSNTSSSGSIVSASASQQQPLHMSHVVVGDIELCMMKQQQQQPSRGQQHQHPEDWESASF